jgi:hypothetical protein
MVLLGLFDTIEQDLMNNAEHEGYHLIIDKVVNALIKPQRFYPSQEGWVISSSLDKRYLMKSSSLNLDFINNADLQKYEKEFGSLQYLAWPRFFQALYFLIKEERGVADREEVWVQLSVAMIEAAVDIAEDSSLMQQDDAVKFGTLAKKMMEKLGFSETKVGEKYDEINEDPLGFYEKMVQDKEGSK